ncbi:MAG: leucine-rich repeat domain-containing protein [Promethearchaeota archaeon]
MNVDVKAAIACFQGDDNKAIISFAKKIEEADLKGEPVSEAYPPLRRLLCHEDTRVRWAAADALTPHNIRKNPYQYKMYSGAITDLKSNNIKKKGDALDWLIRIQTPDMVSDRDEREIFFAIPAIAVCLLDENDGVMGRAFSAIRGAIAGDQDASDAIPVIIHVLIHGRLAAQKKASFAIQAFGKGKYDLSEFLDELKVLLSSPVDEVKFGVADAMSLYFIYHKKWKGLRQLLANPDKDVRQEAVGTLGQTYENISPVLPAVLKTLEDEHEDVRLVAAKTVVKKARKNKDIAATIPIITAMLVHEKKEHRMYAANTFQTMVESFSREYNKTEDVPEDLWDELLDLVALIEEKVKEKDKEKDKENDPEKEKGNTKFNSLLTCALVKYYIRRDYVDKIKDLYKTSSSKIKKDILWTVHYTSWKKSAAFIRFLESVDNERLAKKLKGLARKKVKKLNLSGQSLDSLQLYAIPPEVGLVTSAEALDINHNHLKIFPREIGNLVNLTEINAVTNEFKELPPEIGNLINLETLYLRGNKLVGIPPEIGKLKKLRYIQLSDNKLSFLPPEIGELVSLQSLELGGNALTILPREICALKSLVTITLSNNDLKALPDCLENFENITQLSLTDNRRITEIPRCVFGMKNLQFLYISGCKITSIPPEIGNLTRLTILDANSNQIDSIPDEIGTLTKLTHISLNGNKIANLPATMEKMDGLKWLDLRENPFKFKGGKSIYPTKAQNILKEYFS